MDIRLNETEARVLGSLIEKDITTPDYYPLSLNALVNACNQKNNREPVMNLTEDEVRTALNGLQNHRLAGPARGADSRVTKYEHRIQEVFNLNRPDTAVLCVLLLRGAQTPGELRGRSERMFQFEHLDDVQSTLQRLMERDPPLAAILPRQPGTKESRYMHLLCGPVEYQKEETVQPTVSANSDTQRIARLEQEVARLGVELQSVKEQFADFRKLLE